MAAPRKSKVSTPVTTPAVAPVAAPIAERSEIKGSGKAKVPAVSAPVARAITQDDIARRAYEIYASRGYAPGDQVADWLEAERQLKAGL